MLMDNLKCLVCKMILLKSNLLSYQYVTFSRGVYDDLVDQGEIMPQPEVPPPAVPMDYSWARVCYFLLIKWHFKRGWYIFSYENYSY